MRPSTAKHFSLFRSYGLLLILLLLVNTSTIKAQSTSPYPNPYRIQYHKYQWQVVHTPFFHVYFPKGYDSLCSHICKQYAIANEAIEKQMGTNLQDPPQIIIYPSTDQLYESNIGSTEPKQYTLPTFVYKGNRLLLAHTGSYEALTEQLYEAIARAGWENAFPPNLEAQATGTAIDNDKIPLWYREGTIRYFAHGWRISDEDVLTRSLQHYTYASWGAYLAQYPRLGGQAFCYFLSIKYYPQAPLQLFNQVKKKKDIARAARLIAKKPIDSLYLECLQFYIARSRQPTDYLHPNQPPGDSTNLVIPYKKGIVLQNLR